MSPQCKYYVLFTRRAKKDFNKIPQKDQPRIERVISLLAYNSYVGKKLGGDLQNRYSIRAWPYRIIYWIKKKILVVEVLAIGHRKDIYQK